MKEYISHKRVMAEPMTYKEAGEAGLIRDFDESPQINMDGYKVQYKDGYESWSPKKEFDEGYVAVESSQIARPLSANCSTGNGQGAKELMPDFVTWGNSDTFKLISKFSSENAGVMKSTKAMEYDNGVIVQVTTQQRNPDGSFSVAEALADVKGAKIVEERNDDNELIRRTIK